MLFNGEKVGNGRGPQCDIAVDPIDGTSLTAAGRQNALSVIAVSDRGTHARRVDRLLHGQARHRTRGRRRRRHPPADRREHPRCSSKALGKPIDEMVRRRCSNRPRHEQLIDEIRAAGAGTRLMSDGDVAGGINAARHNARTDMCVGIGGSPEGIVTACAIKALGGHIQGDPLAAARRREAEGRRSRSARPTATSTRPTSSSRGDNTIFVATGVTDGQLVAGVRREGDFIYTESVVLRGRSGTLRRIVSEHLTSKWL